jgi:hypothetical protein
VLKLKKGQQFVLCTESDLSEHTPLEAKTLIPALLEALESLGYYVAAVDKDDESEEES